ncbi:MAG: glycosyltransferase [Sulfolobales archaeon]|nr:glycosyltransferase [Sulfolobales archaeon]
MIAILVQSFRRPKVVRISVPTWLRSRDVRYLVLIAESPIDEEIELYREAVSEIERKAPGVNVIYELYKSRLGHINSRNRLLEIASKLDVDFVAIVDDDIILPNPLFLKVMVRWLEEDESAGAVGCRVIMTRKRKIDPDFFLNLPVNLADPLTRFTGFVFLNTLVGPRYAEFLPPFYIFRRSVAKNVRVIPLLGGTAYREESDIQMQIKRLGYRLVFDPRVYVLHLGLETGGARTHASEAYRFYWKARNHAVFVKRHFKSNPWYLLSSALLLSIYRPWHIPRILNGLRDGVKSA